MRLCLILGPGLSPGPGLGPGPPWTGSWLWSWGAAPGGVALSSVSLRVALRTSSIKRKTRQAIVFFAFLPNTIGNVLTMFYIDNCV